jgi:hypothetical protein
MNQFERKEEEARRLRLMWDESEWRLNFLRSFSPQPLTQPTSEQLLQWTQYTKQLCSVWQTPPKSHWT